MDYRRLAAGNQRACKKIPGRQSMSDFTGSSGKTFTIANVIQALNKPTLVIAHNKIWVPNSTENSRRCSLKMQWNGLFPSAEP